MSLCLSSPPLPPHVHAQAKSTRDSFLQVFPDVFDALFRLCSDPDANVQNATAFLDRLVKASGAAAAGWPRGAAQASIRTHTDAGPLALACGVAGCCGGRLGDNFGVVLAHKSSRSPSPLPYPQDIVAESHEFDVALVHSSSCSLLLSQQDIVAESHEFDVGGFIPTLQEALEVSNPFKRQFLLGWLG